MPVDSADASVTLRLLANSGSPKCHGSSDLWLHVSQTHSVKHPAHRTAANPKGRAAPGSVLPQKHKGELDV